MTHCLTEMLAEAAKHHAAMLERIAANAQVCMDCGVNPIEVIHRPPTIDVAVLVDSDAVLQAFGLPLSNPYVQRGRQVRIIEVLRLLCLECSRRRAQL